MTNEEIDRAIKLERELAYTLITSQANIASNLADKTFKKRILEIVEQTERTIEHLSNQRVKFARDSIEAQRGWNDIFPGDILS